MWPTNCCTVRPIAFGKACADALPREDVAEQCVSRAVELRHRNDIAAAVGEVGNGKVQRGLASCDRESAGAAFELEAFGLDGPLLFPTGVERGVKLQR